VIKELTILDPAASRSGPGRAKEPTDVVNTLENSWVAPGASPARATHTGCHASAQAVCRGAAQIAVTPNRPGTGWMAVGDRLAREDGEQTRQLRSAGVAVHDPDSVLKTGYAMQAALALPALVLDAMVLQASAVEARDVLLGFSPYGGHARFVLSSLAPSSTGAARRHITRGKARDAPGLVPDGILAGGLIRVPALTHGGWPGPCSGFASRACRPRSTCCGEFYRRDGTVSARLRAEWPHPQDVQDLPSRRHAFDPGRAPNEQ
jgi:hypothetical protein